MKTLAQITELLDVIRDIKHDQESDHIAADNLLCDAILTLSDNSDEAAELVKAYERIEKWYA